MFQQFRREMTSGQGDSKFNVVFVLGGPGAGKGTQCEKITELQGPGYIHLSAGELLRVERRKTDSEYGEIIASYITDGNIVPVEITCALLKREMEASGNQNFLIDGFPRNEDNLQGWEGEMDSIADVKFVIFFNCSEEVCINRCLDRGKTSGRSDDNIESLKKRMDTYSNDTMPIINYYRKKGLVREINADQDIHQVFEEVKKLFLPA